MALFAALLAALSAASATGQELSREQLGQPSVEAMARTWGPLAPLATYSRPLAQRSDQAMQAAWVTPNSDTVEGKVALLRVSGIWGVQRYLISSENVCLKVPAKPRQMTGIEALCSWAASDPCPALRSAL